MDIPTSVSPTKPSAFREFLRKVQYANATFLLLSLFMIFMTYRSCTVCNSEYRIPAFSELKGENGTYAAIRRYNSADTGGLLRQGMSQPHSCGYLKEELIGMPATGWFDAEGRMYQLEVSGRIVCDYKWVAENMKSVKRTLNLIISIFLVLCISQFVLFKLSKSKA